MDTTEFISVTNEMVPTIVGFDPERKSYIVGNDARLTGINGKTSIFNFKLDFGEGDETFRSKKKYWYYFPDDSKLGYHIETLSAKEAGVIFLKELLSRVPQPERLVVGEPAVREQQWKDNFKSHMREVLAEFGHQEIKFFPEPFAVFQYYRNVKPIFPSVTRPQNVLVIDIGGGTFNSCIIHTTEKGSLARGGSTAVPLGLQAETVGGSEVDWRLLNIAINKAKMNGIT